MSGDCDICNSTDHVESYHLQPGDPMNTELTPEELEAAEKALRAGYGADTMFNIVQKESPGFVTLAIRTQALLTRREKEIEEWRTEQEKLIWNLAGCSTYAMGYDLDNEHDVTWARAALNDVKKLALKERDAQQRIKALEEEIEEYESPRPGASCLHRGQYFLESECLLCLALKDIEKGKP